MFFPYYWVIWGSKWFFVFPKWAWIGFSTLTTEESWFVQVSVSAIRTQVALDIPGEGHKCHMPPTQGGTAEARKAKGKMAPTFLRWVVVCPSHQARNLGTPKVPKYYMAIDSNLGQWRLFRIAWKTTVIRTLCKTFITNRSFSSLKKEPELEVTEPVFFGLHQGRDVRKRRKEDRKGDRLQALPVSQQAPLDWG